MADSQHRMPIIEGLRDYVRSGLLPYHMPGHKQGAGLNPEFAHLLSEAGRFDLTELPQLDDLHNPQGMIARAEDLAAGLFRAGKTFFLVQGSTLGIQAMFTAACRPGDQVLLPRNIHRSVLNTVILLGLDPIFLPVVYDQKTGLTLGVDTGILQDVLSRYPEIRFALFVNPSYFGLTFELETAVKLCKVRGVAVGVDEAHAAHFLFHPHLPLTAMEAGADFAVQGCHKTLSSLTQTAMLHVNITCPVDLGRIRQAVSLYQTTSPSFLLLASLDAVRQQMALRGQALLDRLLIELEVLRKEINSIPGLQCYGEELLHLPTVSGFDPTKLVISGERLGMSGIRLREELAGRYGIQVELADLFHVLLITTVADKAESLSCLAAALSRLANECNGGDVSKQWGRDLKVLLGEINSFRPEKVLTPQQAFFSSTDMVTLDMAVDRVAGEVVAPYPPGIPLVVPGERISGKIVEYIKILKEYGVRWQGTRDGEVNLLAVVRQ